MNAAGGRPLQTDWVMTGAFASALIINVVLLLLIGGLISRRETRLTAAPNPQPVDFIRILPKTEETKPTPPPEIRKLVDASAAPTPTEERRAQAKPAKASPQQPRRGSKPAKASAALPGVATPRIDMPELGTGAAFAPVPGSDSRLTAPPAQWNPEKKPAEAQSEGEGRAGGSLVVLSRVLPRYPPRAESQGIEGWVRLEITVSPSGTVSTARVVDASPRQIFDEAALEAIRRWRFKPAFREGRAIEQRAMQVVRFRLKNRP